MRKNFPRTTFPAAALYKDALSMTSRTVALLLVAFATTATAQSSVKAFTDLRLIDTTGATPIGTSLIIVRDGRVVAVGPSGRTTIPAGAQRISLG
jgi:imidazolonepropionase-like amidohydrolase